MKILGFLLSLLVHLLFLLLLLRVQFPLIEIPVKAQIIQIVPMSPPPPVERPAPLPVYVRPFVLKGGAPGRARGDVQVKKNTQKAGFPQVADSPRRFPREVEQPSPAAAGTPAPAAAKTDTAPTKQGQPRLTVDMDRVAKILREKNASGSPAAGPGLPGGPGQGGLPFGDMPQPEGTPGYGAGRNVSPGGDGTASHALGGNAFFDSRGYDITPWAKRMVYRVKKNWIFPPVSAYGLKGVVGIYVLIERDGAISRVFIRKTSNIRPFDQAAFNAIELSAPLPPLPDDFPHANLPAYLLFYYN
jgi:outer membrane biosynthesis protein TonB